MPKNQVLAFTLLALFFSLAVCPNAVNAAAPLPAPSGYDVIAAVNALRATYGLPPYVVDPILMMAAQGQADYLASTPNFGSGHVGPGGTDADARAIALGFPYVQGLDINENWATLRDGAPVESLFTGAWSDDLHMHTMLHDRGQLAGAGVAVSAEGTAYVILDVAAYWGDAGLTAQPTTVGWGGSASGQYAVSQYIAPVLTAQPAADGSLTHTVMSGQSLWMIAHHYNVDIQRLRQLNGLGGSDTIYIGQKILINLPQTPTPTYPVTLTPQPAVTAQPPLPTTRSPTAMAVITQPSPTPAAAPAGNATGWFLFFFTLFGAGVILVIFSLSARQR